MANIQCAFCLGPAATAGKYGIGDIKQGSIDIFADHIDVFQKSMAVRVMFGAIGSAIEGKGKPTYTIYKNQVVSYAVKKRNYYLYLNDGNALFVTLGGLTSKPHVMMQQFLEGVPVNNGV